MRAPQASRRRAIVALVATTAGIATSAGLAHTGGSIEGSRYTAVDSVLHPAVLDGNWTFTVEKVTGTVRGLAYIVKSPACPGTIVLEHRMKRQPVVGQSFTTYLDADGNAAADYCSQVIYTGSGSVEVRVTHP